MFKVFLLSSLHLIIGGTGPWTYILEFPTQPVQVSASEDYKYSDCVSFPSTISVTKVSTFLGTSRDAVFEGDIQLYTRNGYYLLQRSEHREGPSAYDGWKDHSVVWKGQELCVSTVARSTNGKPFQIHWQVRLNVQ